MSYTKIHLKLEEKNFKPAPWGAISEEQANYDRFYELMKRVGEGSNWHRRKMFNEAASINRLKELFIKPGAHLWVFRQGENDVGFCQAANVEDLSTLFNKQSGVGEIFKIGMFPEYVGKGLAAGYVSSVVWELFKEFQTIYLNTRDTNSVNSVPFYERLGFEVLNKQVCPDDYVSL